MELFKTALNIRFMRMRKIALLVSLAALLISIGALVVNGLNFGIDFTGGTLIEVGYEEAAELERVRSNLANAGFADTTVQHFGSPRDVMIRLPTLEGVSGAQLSDQVFKALSASGEKVELRRVEFVGPQVGDELTEDGGLAVLYTLIAILIYVGLRFEYRFALGSVIALIHDVLFTLGVFALFSIDFDLTVLAAVLAVIGYSLNDTIVVFDRIRENFRKMRKGTSSEIIDRSLNQTLARTLMTSMTTLVVLLALFFYGGEVIHGFALALIIGVLVGTYSSIYVASAAVLMLGISRDDLMPVQKEGAEFDSMP
jgi:preprotein translocase subunit SecF